MDKSGGKFEWCEREVYGRKNSTGISHRNSEHSVNPFISTGSGHPLHHLSIDSQAKPKSLNSSLNNSGYNSNNIFQLHTPRYNSHINTKLRNHQNQTMFHRDVQRVKGPEKVKLSGENSAMKEQIGGEEAAGQDNPQQYEQLLANIVDYAERNKSHNGFNNEGKIKKSHNDNFEKSFDAGSG